VVKAGDPAVSELMRRLKGTSQALLQYREDEAGSVPRLPATQLEQLVIGQLLARLHEGPKLLSTRALAPLPAAT
jgi:hypothetical protein